MARRGENIYRRNDGRWEGRYILTYDSGGKAAYRSVYGHSYNEVREKMLLFKSGKAPQGRAKNTSFEYFGEKWLIVVRQQCKLSTYNKYKCLYDRYVMPVLGKMSIAQVDSSDVGKILQAHEQLSAKTRSDILSVVRLIIRFAKNNGIDVNMGVCTLSVHQESKQMRVLTTSEQQLLTAYLLQSHELLAVGVYLALYTGVRIGELCALRREDISFNERVLSVTKTMQRVQIENKRQKTEVIITEPKTASSVREIPLPDFVCAVLIQHYMPMKAGDFLLTGRTEKFMEPRSLTYHFRKMIKACGLEEVHFHTLRHTFATRCMEVGFDVKTLSEILGHSNVNITLNRYVHSSMDHKRLNMEKLTEIF